MADRFETYMLQAVTEAQKAEQAEEVPVGAVIVDSAGRVLSRAHNRVVSLADPTAHAEILAIRDAAAAAGNYRLLNTTLYVTVEPCPMCTGAMVHARIQRLVFGAADPRWGAAGSLFQLADDQRLNHRMEVVGGVCEAQCRQLMQAFFRTRR
jgi:tRNA(adenine34) deaminase